MWVIVEWWPGAEAETLNLVEKLEEESGCPTVATFPSEESAREFALAELQGDCWAILELKPDVAILRKE
jgi:hypothetical protein